MTTNTETIEIAARIGAPLERVWAAWAEESQLSAWFTTSAHQDFRVGGNYRNADGDCGAFETIEACLKIAFSWDNPNHSPGTLVTLTFDSDGAGSTHLKLIHSGLKDQVCAKDMRRGWAWAMASLKAYVETGVPVPYDEWLASLPAT